MMKLNPEHIQKVMELVNKGPYLELLGMRLIELDERICIAQMAVGHQHTNYLGRMHGGAYESLMDTATYWALYPHLPENMGYTTLDLDSNLTRSVKEGELVRCESSIIKVGRTIGICQATILDEQNRIAGTSVSKLLISPDLNTMESVFKSLDESVELPPKFIE